MAGGNRTYWRNCCKILNADLVAGQVQHGVQHGRRVPIGKHEAIAIAPFGIRRVVAHELMKEEIERGGIAQRGARMPLFAFSTASTARNRNALIDN